MKKNSVYERLRWANDQCPLPGSSLPSLHHTHWYGEGHNSPDRLIWQPDGYTTIVYQSRLLTWYRSFTTTAPKIPTPPSVFVISEWLPRYEPRGQRGWIPFGKYYMSAYAHLHAEYLRDWRSQAKRHLKDFQKSGATLRLGTKADVVALYPASQVPETLQRAMLKVLDKHLAVHPESIDILVAEKDGSPIACYVAGNCDEIKMSEYIIGAFHPHYKKLQPMVGLIDWWYKRSLARGYTLLTFGHMEPGKSRSPLSGEGYSYFKTHFGIMRIWFPRNRWKFFFNHKRLFSRQ